MSNAAETAAELRRIKLGNNRKSALAAAVRAAGLVDALADFRLTSSESYAALHSAALAFAPDADAESYGPFAENRKDAQYAVSNLADAIEANAAPPALPALDGRPPAPVAAETIAVLAAALEASLSPNTRRAYETAWRQFAEFAAAHGERAMPAHPELVAAYLARRHADGASMATLTMAKAAVAKAHAAAGEANPCAAPLVATALAGFAKQQAGRKRRQARPLDAEAVATIRGHLNGRIDGDARAACTIALVATLASAALRRSEAAALTWGDVDLEAGVVVVRRSKTDALGEGQTVALSASAAEDLRRLRSMRPAEDAAPVFNLSPSQIHRRIAKAAEDAGLGRGFGGHSGRVGCAVTMTRAGAPAAVTMRQARWKDSAMLARYTQALTAQDAKRYLG